MRAEQVAERLLFKVRNNMLVLVDCEQVHGASNVSVSDGEWSFAAARKAPAAACNNTVPRQKTLVNPRFPIYPAQAVR